MNEEFISTTLAENIITALCFDTKSALLIANTVNPGLFESDVYKNIATKAIDFVKQFHEAPKDHVPDLLDEFISSGDRKSELYKKVLVNLYQFKDNINLAYVTTQIEQFVHKQNIKHAILNAAHKIEQNDLEGAESLLMKGIRSNIQVFDPGISFSNPSKVLSFFEELEPPYHTGIKALDKLGIGPSKKELLIILGSANRGKSFALVMLGKMCCLQRLKVLHITLEMSEQRIAQRYIQSFFAISKKKSETTYPVFSLDELNRVAGISTNVINPKSLQDENIKGALESKLARLKNRIKLIVKEFPMNSLSVSGLESYLDYLEQYNHFMPDVIIIDYADIMKVDSSNLRIDTGILYKDLRRIATERDVAMITASQANRLAEDARVVTMKHLAEDYSKAGTADTILAYCQTSAELHLNLGRIFVAKSRNEKREQTIVMSQSYDIGQFCLQSYLMSNAYWHEIDRLSGQDNQPPTIQRRNNLRPRS